MRYQCSSFDALSVDELYALLKLRQDVFVLEQTCLYADLDGLDQQSQHVLAWRSPDTLVGYLRILPPACVYPEPAIGRVVLSESMRGHGFGEALILEGIRLTQTLYPKQNICISAQCYLLDLYKRAGFSPIGEAYDEDGIPHQKMVHLFS